MEIKLLTAEEKFREAYKIIFNTEDIPETEVEFDFSTMQDDFSIHEYRMKDQDMPLIDACPFYRDNDV